MMTELLELSVLNKKSVISGKGGENVAFQMDKWEEFSIADIWAELQSESEGADYEKAGQMSEISEQKMWKNKLWIGPSSTYIAYSSRNFTSGFCSTFFLTLSSLIVWLHHWFWWMHHWFWWLHHWLWWLHHWLHHWLWWLHHWFGWLHHWLWWLRHWFWWLHHWLCWLHYWLWCSITDYYH